MKKIIIIVIASVLLIVTILYSSTDISKPDFSDFKVDRPIIAKEDNAYTYFLAATDSFYSPNNNDSVSYYVYGETIDIKELEDVFAKNKEMISFINRGLECEIYLAPKIQSLEGPTNLPSVLDIGYFFAAKTKYKLLSKKYNEAVSFCISHLKFSNLIQKNSEGLTDYLIGLTLIDFALIQAQDIIRNPNTPTLELNRLLENISNISSFSDGLTRALKKGFNTVNNEIDDLAKERKRLPPFFFQPNKTKLMLANEFRKMIKNPSLYYNDTNARKIREYTRGDWFENEKAGFSIFACYSMGKIFYYKWMPPFWFFYNKCKIESNLIATLLLAKIHLYKRENGSYPKTLQDLVPKYLKSIPKDPYDGKPFGYDLQKQIIYSIDKGYDEPAKKFIYKIEND